MFKITERNSCRYVNSRIKAKATRQECSKQLIADNRTFYQKSAFLLLRNYFTSVDFS